MLQSPKTFSLSEHHFIHRIGWLRAAVLGANDGIVSNASLMFGVASAAASTESILLAGTAGLVAGALSMAAGEYVSVSSQADVELRDLETERAALDEFPEAELEELTAIYESRGVETALARQVAQQLTAHDDLRAHARDELGINAVSKAQPLRAAAVSATSFTLGAMLPVLAALIAPAATVKWWIVATGLLALIAVGVSSAQLGGANRQRATSRVLFWGATAMFATGAIGSLFNVAV